MKKHTRIYRDNDGYTYNFNLPKFKSILDSNARAKGLKKEEYERAIAEKLSYSYDTFIGWKRIKSSPQDINVIHELEKALNLSHNALLYSKEKQLESELNSAKIHNAELLIENSNLKRQIKKEETNMRHSSRVSIIEQVDKFGLKYDGFSNLIDMLIGKYCSEDLYEDISSRYAEELFYILNEYIYDLSFINVLGYTGGRTAEEYEKFVSECDDMNDDILYKWFYASFIDEMGGHLYDQNGKVTLHDLDLWKKLVGGKLFDANDSKRIDSLLGELIDRWDKFVFPYAVISIEIHCNGKVAEKYTYGPGWEKPTHDDRMDIVTSLLLLNNGNISRYALQNATEIKVDEFEMEVSIVYDLERLM